MESNKNEVEDERLKQLDSSFSFFVHYFSSKKVREESNGREGRSVENFGV